MILADAILGQMKEPVSLSPPEVEIPAKPWALTGARGREPKRIKSLYLGDGEMEKHNWHMQEKYRRLQEKDVMVEMDLEEHMDILLVSFGSCSRMVSSAAALARSRGLKVGHIRPITLFPFPEDAIREVSRRVGKVLTVEMNTGQMWDDVRLAVYPGCQCRLLARPGGSIPAPSHIVEEIEKFLKAGDLRAESVCCRLRCGNGISFAPAAITGSLTGYSVKPWTITIWEKAIGSGVGCAFFSMIMLQ